MSSCCSGHVCSIIPPYLLSAIAHSEQNTHETRRAAERTLAHTRALHGTRSARHAQAAGNTGHHQPPHRSIVPDNILNNLAQSQDVDQATRDSAQSTLQHSQGLRADRQSGPSHSKQEPKSDLHREVHNSNHSDDNSRLPGALLLTEGQPIAQGSEEAIGECYDNLGRTFDFYSKVFKRNSIDDRGLPLIGTIHFGKDYGNAFWNSKQMVFGDGNAFIYNFTKALDVIGHELTHGVTENTAGLDYHNQSGALNESVSDVFGVMVKQFHLNQKAADADWLIGEDCLLPGVKGVALRSMKAPGTAFDDPRFGKDPQPASMADYQESSDDDDGDYGGVHTNSGIPNRAFYLAAVGLGGSAWERAGKIWYQTLLDKKMTPDCDFKGFADITCAVASKLYDAEVEGVVKKAWVEVGVYDS
ncbi:hypothetical protein MMC11_002705 [Xylographa trunciseda]|nr:hypothetical protein [Xylographa trunciseda]